jgi:phage shock protein C
VSAYQTYTPRPFYRAVDNAVLGGVCAGIADYFGFNLRVLRFLAIIAFVVAMPMTVIAYLAAVFLIPARSGTSPERVARPPRKTRKERKCERRQARREARRQQQAAPSEAAAEVRDKCQSLDKRLAELEKYITSSRYQLDREIRNL